MTGVGVTTGVIVLGVPVITDVVTITVAETVGVLVGVLVAVGVAVCVEVEVWIGASIGVAVEADCTVELLAWKAIPNKAPNSSRIGTPTMTRARHRRSGRDGAAGTADTSTAAKLVVRVTSSR